MSGILPDSDPIAREAAQTRAHLACLAARDVANLLIKHALGLTESGAGEEARKFHAAAAAWRFEERVYAGKAGIPND